MLQEPEESKWRRTSHQVVQAREASLLVRDRSTQGYPRRDKIHPITRLRNGALRTNSFGTPGFITNFIKYILASCKNMLRNYKLADIIM